eukprot:5804590-Prymnesium_polylepis.1
MACTLCGRPQRRRPPGLLCALCTLGAAGCVGRVCAVRDGVSSRVAFLWHPAYRARLCLCSQTVKPLFGRCPAPQ